MSRFTISRVAKALALAAAIAVSAVACTAHDGTAGAGAPTTTHASAAAAAPAEIGNPAVQALVADTRAAAARHDARTLHRIRARLTAALSQDAVRQAVAIRRQVLANLTAAEAAHDPAARARFRAEVRALCDPAGVASTLGLCGAPFVTHGD